MIGNHKLTTDVHGDSKKKFNQGAHQDAQPPSPTSLTGSTEKRKVDDYNQIPVTKALVGVLYLSVGVISCESYSGPKEKR